MSTAEAYSRDTVHAMHIFEGTAGIDVEVEDDTATLIAGTHEFTLEPEELRVVARACTRAAAHLEAGRR